MAEEYISADRLLSVVIVMEVLVRPQVTLLVLKMESVDCSGLKVSDYFTCSWMVLPSRSYSYEVSMMN